MKALITGASSGIGRDMARVLSDKGYDLILVARRKNRLEKLQKELNTNVEIIELDVSTTFNCMKLYNKVKKPPIREVFHILSRINCTKIRAPILIASSFGLKFGV